MSKLSVSRSKAFAARRAASVVASKESTLSAIRSEGYEDYSYNGAPECPYRGAEAVAYMEGWNQASLEMTGDAHNVDSVVYIAEVDQPFDVGLCDGRTITVTIGARFPVIRGCADLSVVVDIEGRHTHLDPWEYTLHIQAA